MSVTHLSPIRTQALRGAWLAPLLLLAACGKHGANDEKPPTPPPPVADFSHDLDARGGDPAWTLTIRGGTQLSLSRPGQPDIVAVAPGAVITPDQGSWTAPLPDGRSMKVTLYASACSDSAGEQTYPYSAEVDLPGESPLGGCAGKPPASPRRPHP
jgi:uncharacterized membrane protein